MGLFSLLLVVAAVQGGTDDWSGWRGLEHQGASHTAQPPLEWSRDRNVEWAVEVPGEGHSSPVVHDGRIYVTTAYPSLGRDQVKQLLGAATWGLVALTGLFGVWFIASQGGSSANEGASWRSHFGAVAFLVALALFVTLVVFGPALLDFDRCIVRTWLGTNLTAALGLLLAAAVVSHVAPRYAMVLSLAALGVATVVAIPAKDHAFRHGYASASAMVVMAVAAVPITLAVLRGLRRSPAEETIDGASERANGSYTKAIDRSILAVVLLGGWIVAYWIGTEPHPQTPGDTDSNRFIALFTLALGVPVAAWLLITLATTEWQSAGTEDAADKRRGRRYLAIAIVGALAFIGLALGLLFVAIRYTDYLQYHLSTTGSKLKPPAWPYAWLSIALPLLGIGGWLFARRMSAVRSYRWSAVSLFATAVFTSGVIFVDRNMIPARSVLTRAIICYDAETGDRLWTVEGLDGAEGVLHRYNSPATPTPVVDGNHVYAYFGAVGLMCATVDGELAWTNPEVRFDSAYGVGVSPLLHRNMLIIVNGAPDDPHAIGCSAETGALIWRTDLRPDPVFISGHSRTPFVVGEGSNEAVVIWGFGEIDGLNPLTGEKLWTAPLKSSGDMVASVVNDGQRAFFVDSSRTTAIPLKELVQGKSAAAWSKQVRGSNCSSSLVYQGMLFMVNDGGIACCLDAASGKLHWKDRLPGQYYASPVAANGHVYFLNMDGLTMVVAAEKKFRVVASNDLQEAQFASPAIVGDSLILRTTSRLYRLGNKATDKSPAPVTTASTN